MDNTRLLGVIGTEVSLYYQKQFCIKAFGWHLPKNFTSRFEAYSVARCIISEGT